MFKIPLFDESQVHKMAVSNKAPKSIFNIVFVLIHFLIIKNKPNFE